MGSRAANTRGNVARVNIQGRVLFEAHPARGDRFGEIILEALIQNMGKIGKNLKIPQTKRD